MEINGPFALTYYSMGFEDHYKRRSIDFVTKIYFCSFFMQKLNNF